MPRSHQSRYQTHRLWGPTRPGLTHGAGSRTEERERLAGLVHRPVCSITYAALGQLNLRLACRRCDHIRVLHCAPLVFLFERRGWDDRLGALPARFWCSPCRRTAEIKVKFPLCAFVNEEETGEPLPKPDEREWKRFNPAFSLLIAWLEDRRCRASTASAPRSKASQPISARSRPLASSFRAR